MLEHIGEDVDCPGEMDVGHFDRVDGRFDVGVGVDHATHAFDGFDEDFGIRTAWGAFEE